MSKKFQKIKNQIASCELCPAKDCSVFKVLSDSALKELDEQRGWQFYNRGNTLFHEGTRPAGLYCVHSGKVKVYKLDDKGNEQILRIAGAGDLVGYRAVLNHEMHDTYAEIIEDAAICFIPRDHFWDLLNDNPAFSMQIMSRLASELQAAETRVVEMANDPVRERMAKSLLQLNDRFGTKADGKTLNIHMKREDYAHLIGVSTETAIRALRELNDEGLVALKGKEIRILNYEKLTSVAHLD